MKKQYPQSYYVYQKLSLVFYYLTLLRRRFSKQKLHYPSTGNAYYSDFLNAIQDCCEFMDIDMKDFVRYFENHDTWPIRLWEECNEDPKAFNESVIGENGRANICANCVFSFALKYSYDTVSNCLNLLKSRNVNPKVCDYGCANANLSFAMLLREKIDKLVMCDFENESSRYIKYRIDKYSMSNKATWNDVGSVCCNDEFDMIICIDVLEHTPNPSEILKEKIYPMLKRGGFLIAQAPWGGDVVSHLTEAVHDFYGNGGRSFLRKEFKKMHSMTALDVSGVWVKK